MERDPEEALASPGPRYVEAYPRLFAQGVVSNWQRGRPILIWRNQGAIVGRANIHSTSTLLYGAEYLIYAGSYYKSSHDIVKLNMEYIAPNTSRQRAFFLCPACGDRVGALVYHIASWACAKCNFLVNRSMLIGTAARRGERLTELEKLIGRGRPRHMQQRRYDLLRTELVELRMSEGPNPVLAHAGYADIIKEEWHAGRLAPYAGLQLGADR